MTAGRIGHPQVYIAVVLAFIVLSVFVPIPRAATLTFSLVAVVLLGFRRFYR